MEKGIDIWLFYEAMKRKLREKDLSPEEYERLLGRLARELGL